MSDETHCSCCDRDMRGPDGVEYRGIDFQLPQATAFTAVYPDIPRRHYAICMHCWLVSLGVRFNQADQP